MKIEIKEPCHEDWNAMKIGLNSRHCDVCVKSVIDFTSQSRAEIITYLIENKDTSVCGRLRQDQFDFHHSDIPIIVEVLRNRPNNNAFLVLALVALSLSSCAQEDIQHIQRDSIVKTPDLPTQPIMGAMIPPQHIVDSIKKPVEVEIIEMQGEVELIDERPIKGKVALPSNCGTNDGTSKALKFAEKMPEYPGGMDAMYTYVNNYFRGYKKQPKGTAYVRFIVTDKGKTTSISMINIPENMNYLQDDITTMVKKMPNWIPGENNGKKVSVYFTMPVVFK